MKYSIVCADYNFETNDINIYCRDENYNKTTKIIHGFQPYAYTNKSNEDTIRSNKYVTSITEIPYFHIDDPDHEHPLIQFTTESPRHVGDIRKFSSFDVFEADIPFPRRYMIDHELFSGFECSGDNTILHPQDLIPTIFVLKPRVAYFDIETSIKENIVTIICVYDSKTEKYISIAIGKKCKTKEKIELSKNHTAIIVPNEKELLSLSVQLFSKIDPDVATAWWIEFDKEFIDERSEFFKLVHPWNRINVFDMLEPYKKLYNKGSNKLKDVIEAEKLNIEGYEPYQQKFWDEDLIRGIKANKTHVESIVTLDKKLGIIDTYWNYKVVGGFEEMAPAIYHGSLIDIRLLRKYHNKYVLPSKPNGEMIKERNAQTKILKVGGKVFDPPYGRFDNVSVYDLSRYYPSLIISQNLTFERVAPGVIGLFPELALELIEERLKYDRRLDQLKAGTEEHKQVNNLRAAAKAFLNSMFGYCGWSGARCFRLDIFNGITTKGQEGLQFLRIKAQNDGNVLIFGDTDSSGLHMPTNKDCESLIKDKSLIDKLLNSGVDKDHVYVIAHSIEYTDVLNEYLAEFSKMNRFTQNLELKLDRYFSDILFKKYYDNETKNYRGAKKKYVGNVLWEKRPVNYLKIVGFEYIRKDASKITKVIQPRVFEYILSGDYTSVKKYIKDTVDRINNTYSVPGINPDEIAIPTTLSKETTKYGKVGKDGDIVGIPEYVRGSIYANKWLGEDIRESDQVHMVFVKSLKSYPPTDVICYTDPNLLPKDLEIDVELQIRRSIKMPLEDVLDSVDISWKDIFTPNRKLW